MANNSVTLAAVVSNTKPALKIGPEPLPGQHVTLERLTESHFPDLWENVGSHDDVFLWWPEGPYSTASDFAHALNGILAIDRVATYAVLLRSGPHEGKAVGCAMAQWGEPLTNRASEIGALFGPHLQKTRAATEVIFLLGCLLFDQLNYRRMAWRTNSLNRASRKAAERYGLVYEGTWRQAQIVEGRNRDSSWYSMIDSEWPLCRAAFEKWLEDGNFDEQQQQKRSLQDIRASLR